MYKNLSGRILDYTGQTLTEPVNLRGCTDVTVIGGAHVGIEADDCPGTVIRGVTVNPPPGKVGIMVRGGTAHVIGNVVSGGLDSLVFLNVDGGSILRNRLTGYAGDGVHVFGSNHVAIVDNDICDGASDGQHHPDAIQFHNIGGRPAVSDILVMANRVRGLGMGIDNMDDGDAARMFRIFVEQNDIQVAAAHAITMGHCLDSRCVGNTVSLLEGGKFGKTTVSVGPGVAVAANVLGAGVKLVKAAA